MTRYFAFLRAINVGGHTVKMDVLKSLFEGCGFTGVETFIASGNVFFDSSVEDIHELTQTIESCLKDKLGYPVTTFVRTSEELSAIINNQPFSDSDDANIYITFLGMSPDEQVRNKLYANNSTDNHFHIQDREVYWLCRTRFSDSLFSGAQFEKTLGRPATIRNRTTLQKMVNKFLLP
jgi:uncharacterized protein (DUF1697 family)